jgi:hypothetical protein
MFQDVNDNTKKVRMVTLVGEVVEIFLIRKGRVE